MGGEGCGSGAWIVCKPTDTGSTGTGGNEDATSRSSVGTLMSVGSVVSWLWLQCWQSDLWECDGADSSDGFSGQHEW